MSDAVDAVKNSINKQVNTNMWGKLAAVQKGMEMATFGAATLDDAQRWCVLVLSTRASWSPNHQAGTRCNLWFLHDHDDRWFDEFQADSCCINWCVRWNGGS